MSRGLNNTLVVLGGILVLFAASFVIVLFTTEVLHLGREWLPLKMVLGYAAGYPVGRITLRLWKRKPGA